LLEDSPDKIDREFLGTIIAAVERFEEVDESSAAEQLRELYRHALKISMQTKMKAD
jgi:hypothetical protein